MRGIERWARSLLVLALTSCGAQSEDPVVPAGAGQTETSVVPAAGGGEVAVGSASLDIPQNALANDTEVTIRIAPPSDYPDLERPRSNVLVLEPEGTILTMPASVSLAASLGDGNVSVVQYLSVRGTQIWQPLTSGVMFGAESVSVAVSQFAPLAVVGNEVTTGGTGAIEGTVRWSDGSGAPGAEIDLLQEQTVVAQTIGDDAGAFGFSNLAAGTYTISLYYECELLQEVSVSSGATTSLDLVLCSF
jgi:hypothetical protein